MAARERVQISRWWMLSTKKRKQVTPSSARKQRRSDSRGAMDPLQHAALSMTTMS
jgi:hypothetical protein